MTSGKKDLPNFVQSRIDFFIEDLISKNNNGKHLVSGLSPKSDDIILQSNDYLDLANHDELRLRVKENITQTGKCNSVLMSAIYLQDSDRKSPLEDHLAQFANFDSCLLSQSGWAANISLLQAISSPETNIYIDFFAHMSMWEGARYTNSKIRPFMHNNCDHLRKLIKKNGPGIIVVDSIYSTIGTIAPLTEIVALAKEFNCATLVDESHSLGVYGTNGKGLLDELGLTQDVDFMTASLAKTFAYRAGAIWANNNVNQCIPYVGYPAIFSSALLPYENEILESTLDAIHHADDRRNSLFENSRMLREGMTDLGIDIRSESQIISLETGNEKNTELVRDYLENNGVFGAVFCRPATSKNRNLIRFSMNSSVSGDEINHMLSVFKPLTKSNMI